MNTIEQNYLCLCILTSDLFQKRKKKARNRCGVGGILRLSI